MLYLANYRQCLVLLITAMLCSWIVSEQVRADKVRKDSDVLIDPYTRENMSWTTADWTGNEEPYLDARSAVDAAASRPDFDNVVNDNLQFVAKHPEEKLAAFKAAYSIWTRGLVHHTPGTLFDQVCANYKVMDSVDLANTYDGARMKFLFEVMVLPPNPRLIPLGNRLLTHTPNDMSVLISLAGLYRLRIEAGDMSGKTRCLDLCKQALALCPDQPMVYGQLRAYYDDMVDHCDDWSWKSGTKMTAQAAA